MKKNSPKIYIILLNYNGWEDTIECLESIYNSSYPDFQVVIVDNNSPNDSLRYIQAWAEGKICSWLPENNRLRELSNHRLDQVKTYVQYTKKEALNGGGPEEEQFTDPMIMIQSGENRGFSAGYNVGIQYVLTKENAKYLMILNNDTVVDKDFLYPLVQRCEEDSSYGIVGPKIMHYLYPDNIFSNGARFTPWTSHIKFLHSGEKDRGQTVSEVSFLSGAAWFIPVSTIKEVGLLDERYFMYMEDVDFTQKVRSYGKKLGVASHSKVFHKGAQSSGGGNSDFSVYWISKNFVRYVLNNLSFLQKITSITYFFYNILKASVKSVLKGRKPKVKIALIGFYEGFKDIDFGKEVH